MSEEADYSSHAELLAFAGSVAAGAGADGDSDGDGTCDVDDAAGGGGGGGGGGGRTHLSGALAMTWLLHEAGAAGGGEAGADAADEAAEDAHAEARGADARGAGADGSGGGGAGAAAAAAEPYTPIAAKKFPPEWAMLAKAVWASYGSTEAVVRAQLAPTFSGDELVFSWLAAAPFLPGHLILISKALEAVVVVIRGTANMFDVSADFRWRPVPMPGLLLAHEGMVACAERLLGPAHGATVLAGLRASGALPPAAASGRRPPVTLFDALAALLESRPGWTLLFTGHSLGGGVSAVLEQLALQHWHTLEAAAAGEEPQPPIIAGLVCRQPIYLLTLGAAASVSPVAASVGSLTKREAHALAAMPPGEEHDEEALAPLLVSPVERYLHGRSGGRGRYEDWPLATGFIYGMDCVPRLSKMTLTHFRAHLACPVVVSRAVAAVRTLAHGWRGRAHAHAHAPPRASSPPGAGATAPQLHLASLPEAHASDEDDLTVVENMLHACQRSHERSQLQQQRHSGGNSHHLGERSLPPHAPAAAAAAAAQHVLNAATGAPLAGGKLAAHYAVRGSESLFAGAARVSDAIQRQTAKISAVLENFAHAPPGSPLAAIRRRITAYTLRCPQRECLYEGQPLATPGLILRVMPVHTGAAPRPGDGRLHGTAAAAAAEAAAPDVAAAAYCAIIAPPRKFASVRISSSMIADHATARYLHALDVLCTSSGAQELAFAPEAPAPWTAEGKAWAREMAREAKEAARARPLPATPP